MSRTVERKIRTQVGRARRLAARCEGQSRDEGLPFVERVLAGGRAKAALKAAEDLEALLDRLQEEADHAA